MGGSPQAPIIAGLGTVEGTQIGNTTLSAAVAISDTAVTIGTLSITVGPLTTVTARNPQWGLKVDSEIMAITGLGSGTTVFVARGENGTKAAKHAKGANVWAAPMAILPPVNPKYNAGPPARFRVQTVQIGSVAYGSFGNATTTVAGTLYAADCFVPENFYATGIAVLNGGTVATDKGMVYLLDDAGNTVAASSTAGATTSGANAFQTRAFVNGPVIVPGGHYWLCYQSNGTTDNIRTVAASTFVDVLTTSLTGTFGTAPTWVIPTTFTANVGPIAYLY